jgi:hypothetical protein
MQAREGELRLGLHPGRVLDPEPGRDGGLTSVLQQGGLADSGLPAHHQHPAVPVLSPSEQAFDRLVLDVPAHQHRLVLSGRRPLSAGIASTVGHRHEPYRFDVVINERGRPGDGT